MTSSWASKSLISLSALFLFGCTIGHASGPDSKPATSRQAVVVELFTAEGCSSCPPADALLKELSETQPVSGAQIVALEEHVDYWNQLGWSDPFSSEQYSFRQNDYASKFGNGSSYTPQMVVDGSKEFVGSRSHEARASIEEAARRTKTQVSVTEITSERAGSRALVIAIPPLADATSKQGDIWLAVTESGLQSTVKAGENSGETLQHAPVVRVLRKVGDFRRQDGAKLQTNVTLEKKWRSENVSIVVFLADKQDGKIFGASFLKLGDAHTGKMSQP